MAYVNVLGPVVAEPRNVIAAIIENVGLNFQVGKSPIRMDRSFTSWGSLATRVTILGMSKVWATDLSPLTLRHTKVHVLLLLLLACFKR